MTNSARILLIAAFLAHALAQDAESTTMTETTSTIIDCFVQLGSDGSPVDGSFESLRSVASTSASPGLNSDVTSGGWFNGVNSADSFLAPYVSGQMNVPESPDGGVFVGAGAGSNVADWQESFYTTVEGLVVGVEYTIMFYQACTADAYGRTQDGNQAAWEISFGDETKVSPTCTYQQGLAVWSEVSLTFTPTSATQRLEFLSKDISNAGTANGWMNYMIADGITVTPNIPRCTTTTAAPTVGPTKLPTPGPTSTAPSVTPSISEPSAQPSSTAPSVTPSISEPSAQPSVTEQTPNCVDISECYSLSFTAASFTWLEPVDDTMCVYRIQFSTKADGTSGLRPANPSHLRFFVDSNGDSQVEMGVLDESSGSWTMDSISRVTTNDGGIEYKMDLEWSNGATYIASGFDDIEGCLPSESPSKTPSHSTPSQTPSVSMPSALPSAIERVPRKFCYPADPTVYVILPADMQSLTIGGPLANECDDGCVVTEVSLGSYTLTNNDGTPDAFGAGGFSILGSSLTWINKVVFTEDACPPAKCVDISECYTLNFIDSLFGWLEPVDETMCVYEIQFSTTAEGTSALRPANPTHLRFFLDSNFDSQLEMGYFDESTGMWQEDSISRVTTNEHGIGYKMDLHWSNGGVYFASGFDTIEGCGPSMAPTPEPTNDPCLNWVERFEYLDHACASGASVFEQSELPSRKMWNYSNKFGWYALTQNMDDSECRDLCEDTDGCVTFAYQPTVGQAESGCFLYSEENCAAIVADGGYRIRDKVIDCSVTSSTTTTVQTTSQTTIDPQEAACPNGNTLDFLGDGRCADNGEIVDWPAAGYFLKTTKEDCLSQCEENADCTGAITAYNYYCAHYLSSDIAMFDGEPSQYQTQWECHAKCHHVKREGTCNEFLVDYRIPGPSIYYTTRVSGNPIDGWYLPAICAAECEQDVQCKAFAFDTSGNTCHFGNSAELVECDFSTGNCGRSPGRMTAGSCDNSSDGAESVCPRGFTPHGVNGELNLRNHATGGWPKVGTIEECAAYCETVSCVSFEYDNKSKLCATHTEADLDSRANPAGWVACLLDMDAPSFAPTPASEGEECPIGFHQVGDLSTNNDIGGYGMSTKDEVYTYATFDACIERCELMPGCLAFNWNQAGMCVYYDTTVPNRDDGRGFIFCARDEQSTEAPDCELSLGTEASPVDGSFESLLYAARTSDNPGLNGNVNGAGWRNGLRTADSFLAPYVVGDINVPESPDGGVFAAGGAMLDNEGIDIWKESFYTTVENLQIGEEYTVKFYQACTADPYGRSLDGNYAAWEVHFGDDMQMAPSLIYDSSIIQAVWSQVSLTFVASSESERLEFVSKALGGPAEEARWMNYILIDGISVSANTLDCVDPTMAPTTSLPTMLPTVDPTTPQPTMRPTAEPTPQPTASPVMVPYNGPEYFCDTYQDPHIDTWHLAGSQWTDYRIDLAHTDAQLHRGDWLIFEYGAYQVIMSHAERQWWNTHMYIKKNGAVIYSYSGRTAERVIDHSEVEVVTNPASTWVSNVNYRGYGSGFEYELVKLRNIPLEATWLQEKAYRDATSPEGRAVHGAILDVALKWNEDWRVTSGVCSATKANYAQFKLGDDVFGTGNRRELVQESELETCPILSQCCGRLAGLANQYEACQLDNYDSCCATGADPATCCGGWVQEAPRCSEDSCGNGEACNFIDGYCYPEAQIAAVTAYKGTCHSQTDVNVDLDLCSMESGSLTCDQTMATENCENGFAYLSKTIGGKRETTYYDSCEFEWYAEYSCQPPVMACPSNYVQVGDFGAHPDASDELEMRLGIQTVEQCKMLCDESNQCIAFTFARPGEEMSNEFVCTSYKSVVSTSVEGSRIFCKSMDAPLVGTVTFDAAFETSKCTDLLEPLRQVVARVARVEVRHVRTKVDNCESGSFTIEIDAESANDLERLQETVEDDVFVQRLNHELGNHGKSSASSLTNVSTSSSSDSDSYKTAFFVTATILCVLVVAIVGWKIKQCVVSKGENEFDPELPEKRVPELKSEVSLKTIENQDSGTFFEHTWAITSPRGETLPVGSNEN